MAVGERGAVGERAVGFDRERDDAGDAALAGGPGDADRLGRVRQREGGDEIGSRSGERRDLLRVVALGLVGRHGTEVRVRVAAGTDAPAHHHRRTGAAGSKVEQELHRPLVGAPQPAGVVAQQGGPVRVRSPGRGLEDDPEPGIVGDLEVLAEVPGQLPLTIRVVVEHKAREVGQLDAPVEDEVGLDAPVGHEDLTGHLWQQLGIVHGW